MGGTEKWMNDTARKISRYEKTQTMSVHPRIANVYGSFVLNRRYLTRVKKSELYNHTVLDISSFIPFTLQWTRIREQLLQARLIYTRYEILEMLMVIYFVGLPGIKKTVVGMHSPFLYSQPINIFERAHNLLYGSYLYKTILNRVKRVHILNSKDEEFLLNNFKLQNVVYAPNGVEPPKMIGRKATGSKTHLNVLFVGELSRRKGIDILIKIIRRSPRNIHFTIAGDGYLRKDVERAAKSAKNFSYIGYADKNKLEMLYHANDVFILTSRAESMSLALLEAMSYGLLIVDSTDTALHLNENIEYSCDNKNIKTYIDILKKLHSKKKERALRRSEVRAYFNKNFSSHIIDNVIARKIFGIKYSPN